MDTKKLLITANALEITEAQGVTPRFASTADTVTVCFEGAAKSKVKLAVYCYDGEGRESEVSVSEHAVGADGSVLAEFSFDPVSLAVYKGACEFRVTVSGEGLSVRDFSVSEKSAEAVDNSEDTLDNTTVMADGTKGVFVTLRNGERVVVPRVPKKALFIGNSLVFGMFMRYGMCASAPDKDYYHYVTEYIRKFEPDCVFAKQYGSFFEHSESVEAFDAWFYNDDRSTGKGAVENLTDDLDLIFLQMGDNVNTDLKQKTFNEVTAELLIERIKERCPRARIIWIHGWYNYERTAEKIKELCQRWGIERVDMSGLRSKENEGHAQKTCIGADGSVCEVSPRWVTHPGDLGMQKIADKIIRKLKL